MVFDAELVDVGADALRVGVAPGLPGAPGAPAMTLFPAVEDRLCDIRTLRAPILW